MKRLRPGTEAIALAADRVFIRGPQGSLVLHEPAADVLEVISAIDRGGMARLPSRLQGLAQTLIDELDRELFEPVVRDGSDRTPPSIAVIGGGEVVGRIVARLERAFGTICGGAPPSERIAVSVDRAPARVVERHGFDRADLDHMLADHDLLVVALESATWSSYATINEAAVRSQRAATLFLMPEAGSIQIGPLLWNGARPCWQCDRLNRLGVRSEADLGVLEAFEALAVSDFAEVSPLVEELASAAVIDEAAHVLAHGIPRVPGSVVLIGSDGISMRRRCLPLAACPVCRTASPRARPLPIDRPPMPMPGVSVTRAVERLEERGVSSLPHAVSTFREHLVGTHRILAGWGCPRSVALAGLYHSVYGSDTFDQPVFLPSERARVVATIGAEAERLVALFCSIDRAALGRALQDGEASRPEGLSIPSWRDGSQIRLTSQDVEALVLIGIANTAEQAHAGDRSPAMWLARCARQARWIGRTTSLRCPPLATGEGPSETDEARAVVLYRGALLGPDPEPMLREAIELNPWVGEPMLVAAWVAQQRGDRTHASSLAARGVLQLTSWGTAWDKRVEWECWLGFGERLVRGVATEFPLPNVPIFRRSKRTA